jgi:hypothetical protein
VGLAFLLSDAISIEKFLSFQIAIAINRDNIFCFLGCVSTTLHADIKLLSSKVSKRKFLSFQIATSADGNNVNSLLTYAETPLY